MKRLTQITLVGVFVLAMLSIAVAQQAPQPVVRIGNYMEVANDLFMHIIAATEMHYNTVENRDFEKHVRDRPNSRFPGDTAAQLTDSDAAWFQNRLGVEARYQKNLEMYLLFEHRQFVDGNTIDDRSNSTTPGGTDVFNRAPATENPGFHTERYWIRYKFPNTPFKLHVGADLWNVDQAGLYGDDDPRIAVFGDFGDFDVMAHIVPQYESQRIGLSNDNDLIVYALSAGYNLKPHRFQLDVVYFRDRFAGADLAYPRGAPANGIGYPGQKTDSVLLMGSASGRLGPVRGLVQGLINVGHARGGVTGLTSATAPTGPQGFVGGRGYDIFSGAVAAYAEADLGLVRPYVAFIWGSGDGDPTDNKLHGFSPASNQDVSQITGTSWFEHLDTSANFAGRDYACPARSQGVRSTTPANTPFAIGANISQAGSAGFECSHTVGQPFNQRLGNTSTPGIYTTYSNPGTMVIAPGVKVYPLKGYEIVGFYVYRGMVNTNLLKRAFLTPGQCVGVTGCVPDPGFTGRIRKDQIHEFGGYMMWTLNPYFDIRLLGQLAFLGDGFKDLARLADCDQRAGFQACAGKDVALRADIRFRARF